MLTIVLFFALLILCWVVYKSIDWFEKSNNYDRIIHYRSRRIYLYDLRAD